ncbi:hypothetical protein TNCV_3036641 [Trichonephila clavipes]|nr:hypothetical protein TNCV_3036641 [Trichonephila clavipes]
MRACDFHYQKISRLQPGSNPQPWAGEANTLPLSHRVHMPDTKEMHPRKDLQSLNERKHLDSQNVSPSN